MKRIARCYSDPVGGREREREKENKIEFQVENYTLCEQLFYTV